MDKKQFLAELKKHLSGMSQDEITDVMDFYKTYFEKELINGRTEDEIIKELGSPLLLAKSIKTSSKSYNEYDKSYKNQESTDNAENDKVESIKTKFNRIKNKVIIATMIIVIVSIILAITAGVIALAVKVAVPILVILGIIYCAKLILNKW